MMFMELIDKEREYVVDYERREGIGMTDYKLKDYDNVYTGG